MRRAEYRLWAEDLTGQRFGRLIVISRFPDRKCPRWECRCTCGGRTVTRTESLKAGTTQSCGCYARERVAETHTLHGHTFSRKVGAHRISYGDATYRSWVGMRSRCKYESHPSYSRYGGRGITVCARWEDFAAFLQDMGERPAGTSLDRIDNNGNYEPGNCRWATRVEQMRNSRPALRQTCVHGHPYVGANLYVNKLGHRKCRACAREAARVRYHRIADATP